MSGLIGKKIGMTSVYSAEGKNIPCTVIEAGPCVVTQIIDVGVPAILSVYFDWFSGIMQAFIFCMLTVMYIANAAEE